MKPLQSPFAHLSRLDLLTAQDLRLWAGSALGQSIISTLRPNAEPYAPGLAIDRAGKAVPIVGLKGRSRSSRAELQAEQWYKDRQAIDAFKARRKAESEILFGQIFNLAQQAEGERLRRLAASKQAESWRFGHSPKYKPLRLGQYVLHPAFKPNTERLRDRLKTEDVLASYVHQIALQGSSAALRRIRHYRDIGQSSQDDALLCAISATAEKVRHLAKDWPGAERLAVPAFNDRTLLSERARRRYLFRTAYRAAYRELSRLPAGLTGDKSAAQLYFSELTEWQAGAWDELEAEYTEKQRHAPIEETRATGWNVLPCDNSEDRQRQARVLLWQRIVLGSPWGFVALLGSTQRNEIAGFRAVVRRWAVLVRILQGESEERAAERCGFGSSFVRDGKVQQLVTQACGGVRRNQETMLTIESKKS